MTQLTDDELAELRAVVTDRYRSSGKPDEIVEALDRHNDRVLAFVDEIAEGEHLDTSEHRILQAVAVLHDVAKADTHLLHHAHAGAEIADELLRGMGKDEDFVDTVRRGIECHMGPFPFVEEEAVKHAERTGEHLHFPRPASRMERLFYDADMLALIDVEGVEKVVMLRRSTPEFMEEDERTAAEEGTTPVAAAYASALLSARRAAGTLFSDIARGIAQRLLREAEEHADRQTDGEIRSLGPDTSAAAAQG